MSVVWIKNISEAVSCLDYMHLWQLSAVLIIFMCQLSVVFDYISVSDLRAELSAVKPRRRYFTEKSAMQLSNQTAWMHSQI